MPKLPFVKHHKNVAFSNHTHRNFSATQVFKKKFPCIFLYWSARESRICVCDVCVCINQRRNVYYGPIHYLSVTENLIDYIHAYDYSLFSARPWFSLAPCLFALAPPLIRLLKSTTWEREKRKKQFDDRIFDVLTTRERVSNHRH